MHLDLPTLDVMGALIVAAAGAVLLVAWSQDRKTPALALWGIGSLFYASGIASLMLASALNQPAWSLLGEILLVLANGVTWKAARSFDAQRSPIVLVLLGAAVVTVAGSIPGMRAAAGVLGLAFSAAYLFAASISIWLGRTERLKSRWPMIVLTALHATVLLVGLFSSLDGALGPGAIPKVFSWFGSSTSKSLSLALVRPSS